MQALRLARAVRRPISTRLRCLATSAPRTAEATVSNTQSSSKATPIPLSNVEAQWERLSSDERLAVHEQLEQLQKKDWKQLSIDEKKAGAFAFSPRRSVLPIRVNAFGSYSFSDLLVYYQRTMSLSDLTGLGRL